MLRNKHSRNRAASSALLVVAVSLLTVAAAACSSSNPTATGGQSNPTTPAATSPPPSSGGSDTDLSGTWSGQYSGTFSGTFKLSWTQSSSKLNGTIDLNPGGISSLNGTVSGNTIKFGTVGSQAITYTGTVSGDSMSGTYTVHTANGTVGGSWSANKTS